MSLCFSITINKWIKCYIYFSCWDIFSDFLWRKDCIKLFELILLVLPKSKSWDFMFDIFWCFHFPSYQLMTGKTYQRCVTMRNQTTIQTYKLSIMFVTTDIDNNICSDLEYYDVIHECYQYACLQKHIMYSVLTLGNFLIYIQSVSQQSTFSFGL